MKKQFFYLLFLFISMLSLAQSSLDSLRLVLPMGHSSYIQGSNIDIQKKFIVTNSWDQKSILWDRKTGKQIVEYKGHSNAVISSVFHPNGRELITATFDGKIYVWDIRSGTLLKKIVDENIVFRNVDLTKEGDFMLISSDTSIIVVDYKTGQKLYSKNASNGSFHLSKDNSSFFISDRNHILKIDTKTSDIILTLKFEIQIERFLFSPDEKTIVLIPPFSSIYYLVNLDKDSMHVEVKHNKKINTLVFSDDSENICSTSSDSCIIIRNIKKSTTKKFRSENGEVVWASFTRDNNQIIYYSTDHKSLDQLTLIDLNNGEVKSSNFKNTGDVWDIKLYEDLNMLVVSSTDYNTKLISLSSLNYTLLKGCAFRTYNYFNIRKSKEVVYAFYSDKDPLMSTSSGISELDLKTMSFSFASLHESWIYDFSIDEENSNILTSSSDKKVSEWNLEENKLNYLAIFNENVKKTFYSKDINELYIVFSKKIAVYNRLNNKIEYFFSQENVIQDVAVSRRCIAILDSKKITIIGTNDLMTLLTIPLQIPNFNEIFLSQDGNFLIIKSFNEILIYSIADGKANKIKEMKGVFEGHCVFILELTNENIVYVNDNQKNYIVDLKRTNILSELNSKARLIHVQKTDSSDVFSVFTKNDSLFVFRGVQCNQLVTKFYVGSKYIISVVINEYTQSIVLSFIDNSNHVYSLNSGKEIGDYIILHNNNFLIKLPNSPYYMCSKDASKMLHYVTPSLKVIGFEQLDPVYNRPDIVLDSIGKYFGGADQELVANYRQSWEKRIDRLGLDKERLGKGEIAVPNAEIVDADNIAYENKEGNLNIKVSANDSKYPLRRFNVFVNEVPLYGSAGISIAHLKKQVWDTTVSVPLSVGENKIQVSVMNELGLENFKYPTYVNYMPNKDIVAKTHYIGIGVNEFKEPGHKLNYCVKDVRDLAKAFATENKHIDTLLFTDQQVTKENILALKEYLNKTSVNDKVIISCSSHGLLDDSLNFYLAMHDVNFNNPKARGLKYEELESLLDGIPARQKLLLLDACNSGEIEKQLEKETDNQELALITDSLPKKVGRGFYQPKKTEKQAEFQKMNELFVNVRNNTGSVIISAAGGQQSALEGDAVKVDGKTIENGAFTYSILECLKQNEGKELKVNVLKQYAEKRVEEITNGRQKPTSRQETMEVDWEVR